MRASNSLERWSETMPIVLLGCRSAIKSDLGYSASELLYGTHLALPGTMFTPINNSSIDFSSCVARLRTYFAKLPPMANRPQTTSTHVPRDMDKWTHVFVRNDAVRGPLNSPPLSRTIQNVNCHLCLNGNIICPRLIVLINLNKQNRNCVN